MRSGPSAMLVANAISPLEAVAVALKFAVAVAPLLGVEGGNPVLVARVVKLAVAVTVAVGVSVGVFVAVAVGVLVAVGVGVGVGGS